MEFAQSAQFLFGDGWPGSPHAPAAAGLKPMLTRAHEVGGPAGELTGQIHLVANRI